MSKLNPGPWDVKHENSSWFIYGCLDETIVAYAFTEKDAYLIASAPELLGACKLALSSCDPHEATTKYIELIIDKAEGKKIPS